jgi:hypothetical protein
MQLSLNLDPIINTKTEVYKGWEIVAYQRAKSLIVKEAVSEFYRQRYNQIWSEYKVNYYYETIIYQPKHPSDGKYICGEHSGCWNFDIAIECTKKYIDHFYS